MSDNGAKIGGGILIGLLALGGGAVRYADDVFKLGARGARGTSKFADEFGDVGRFSDDVGRLSDDAGRFSDDASGFRYSHSEDTQRMLDNAAATRQLDEAESTNPLEYVDSAGDVVDVVDAATSGSDDDE